MPNEVELFLDGRIFTGWEFVSIARDLESGAGGFRLGVTDPGPASTIGNQLVEGAPCEIKIDGDRVLVGYTDAVSAQSSRQSHTTTIEGRDRTGQLVDCSAEHPTGKWTNRTILEIATELADPFDIEVQAQVDVGSPFERWQLQPGETVFESIERAARQKGLRPVPDENGRLTLTRTGSDRASGAIRWGDNVLESSWSRSIADRYSAYTVKGQAPGGEYVSAQDSTSPVGEATDPNVPLHRPLTIIAEEPGSTEQLRERAQWEAAARLGRSLQLSVTVPGWRQSGGALWRPNILVYVEHALAGIRDELVISSVQFSKGDDGTRTTMSLSPRSAFALGPIVEKTSGSVWR